MYKLKREGKLYLKNGLPEENLLDLLSNNDQIPVQKIKSDIDNASIAINWALKNGWIKIINDEVKLVEKPEEYVLKNNLENVSNNKDVPQDKLDILEERGLVERVREDVVKRAKEQLEQDTISNLTPELIKTGLWREAKLKKYDPTKTGEKKYPGKKHILTRYINKIRRIFLEMGFEEVKGPYVESSFWNFDALYQPQDHPARDMHDTFFVENPPKARLPDQKTVGAVKRMHEEGDIESRGWGYEWQRDEAERTVLRTHTTSVSMRSLKKIEPPAKIFSIGRTFRNETLDYSHLPEFTQIEGIVVDENVSFRDLQGYLKEFYTKLGFKKVRFRPAYFPYTEMSVEPEVYFEEQNEWLELGGSGILRPEVTRPLGIDVPVLAWGLGLERPLMLQLGLQDIRNFYFKNDIDFLRKAKM